MPERQIKSPSYRRNRLILLGASNLTLSRRLVISLMQQHLGGPSEVMIAAGHGRAYSISSQVLLRGIPGIAESELWLQLEKLECCSTYALLTDIGNDILFGVPPEKILRSVEWCVARLQKQSAQIVVTNLPIASIEQLTERSYMFFRNLFYPFCKLRRAEMLCRVQGVYTGLLAMADRLHFKLCEQHPTWFGSDGIHVNYWQREAFYRTLLEQFSVSDPVKFVEERGDFLLAWQQRPKFFYKTILGYAISTPQPSGRLMNGSTVSQY